ncbi:hypothetical protein XI09_35285 [Bradyrhizobium sp. CCBAU 11386]|uniref:hypothetical protein n=1 Tax=Bradyrhizobium sp. CCBAU 11386 TaxID=1630837 RepID=UPI002FE0C44D|nr:hypothetical protein [Bradyrhizobium sp. CCBAU 11386]
MAAKTLPADELSYGIFSGDRERLSRAIVTLVSEEDGGRPIAFNALSVMPVELDGASVDVTHLGLELEKGPYVAETFPVHVEDSYVIVEVRSHTPSFRGICAANEPEISRFRVWSCGPSRNDMLIEPRSPSRIVISTQVR